MVSIIGAVDNRGQLRSKKIPHVRSDTELPSVQIATQGEAMDRAGVRETGQQRNSTAAALRPFSEM